MKSTIVIIPTYNERQNLMPIVGRVLKTVPETHVLIVDDNSPDGTGPLADDLAAADPRVHVLHRADKSGLGAAYQAGFRWALDRGYEQLVEMDGDGSHQPEQLPRLLGALEAGGLALGSRWVPGGTVENWPRRRVVLSRGGSLYARIALGLPFRDITGGYRAFSREALEAIDLPSILSQGYCFQIDMLWHAHRAGLRIAEVPITFVERRFGVSKMSPDIVGEAVIRVTLWGLRSVPSRLARWRRAFAPAVEEPAHATWS
ncbi:MAG: polyprenol monophosphomannose synthase [Terrimesophilobacter sp.]